MHNDGVALLSISEDAIGLIIAYVLQTSDSNPCEAHRGIARSLPYVCRSQREHLWRTRPLLHLQAAARTPAAVVIILRSSSSRPRPALTSTLIYSPATSARSQCCLAASMPIGGLTSSRPIWAPLVYLLSSFGCLRRRAVQYNRALSLALALAPPVCTAPVTYRHVRSGVV